MRTHMRSATCRLSLLVLVALLAAAAARGDAWEARAPIPHHVYGQSAAVLNGRLHVLGGCHTSNWQVPCGFHQVFDPAADAWSLAPELPLAVAWGMPAVHKGKIYLFGGGVHRPQQGITSTERAWVFDPAANRWSPIRDLPVPIMNGFAVAAGDFIYVGLGYHREGGRGRDIRAHHRNTYRYDPARDLYERVADAPEEGCYAAAGVWNVCVYVVHGAELEIGFEGRQEYQWADGALKYDPAADRWTKIDAPRMKKRVFYLTQCTSSGVFGSKLFAVGGMGEQRERTSVAEYFDMARESFHELPPIPRARCCGSCGVVDGHLILTGGFWGTDSVADRARETWLLHVGALDTAADAAGRPHAHDPNP